MNLEPLCLTVRILRFRVRPYVFLCHTFPLLGNLSLRTDFLSGYPMYFSRSRPNDPVAGILNSKQSCSYPAVASNSL